MLQENRVMSKATRLVLALVSISAIVLISYFAPYIPDYDGLGYYNTAKAMNGWLFSPSDYRIWTKFANDYVSFWPISNALSVFIAAIFINTINANLIPVLINAIYLYSFAAYVTKIRSALFAYIAALLLCSHTLFFRLFTTLTTEFAVGLWIFAFLLTLISNHERRGAYLAGLTIIGVMLRTIDIVFVLMAVSAYAAIYYLLWKDRRHTVSTLRYVGLSLLLTAPLFFQHYKVAFQYVYNVSFGATAASWKSLGGVSDRYDVILQYEKFLALYNPLVIPGAVLVAALGFYSKEISGRSVALVVGISLSVCFPLLMASSLNIQVVFWVYTALILIVCEIGFSLFRSIIGKRGRLPISYAAVSKFVVFVISIGCVFFLAGSWDYEVRYLAQQKDISNIAFDIVKVLESEPGTPTIAANYRGVGALDMLGLAWQRKANYSDGNIEDIYSKNRKPAEYLELKEDTNFFIAAHENYFFAPHFGINDHIKETHRLFSERSSVMGFRKVQEISRDGRNFDIWYRPGVQAYLQYARFGDKWISWKLPLVIGSEKNCAGDRMSGKLNVWVDFPNPGLPGYAPPFLISFYSKKLEGVVSSVEVNKYGVERAVLDLKNIACGEYELSINKAFSTKSDPRELSALFIKLESAFKFDAEKK